MTGAQSSSQRACITGLGYLGPFGVSVEALRQVLMQPAPAYRLHDLPAMSEPPRQAMLGLAPDFRKETSTFLPPAQRRRMNRHSRMACVAAGQALRHAGLLDSDNPGDSPASDCGVVYGTALGSTGQCGAFFDDFLDKGPRLVNPALFLETVPNAPAGQISILYGLHGPNATICSQTVSAEAAVIAALDLLDAGMAPAIVIVTAEELSPALLCGMQSLKLLRHESDGPGRITIDRTIIPAEGACAMVLENESHARKRGARVLARIHDAVMHGPGTFDARSPYVEASMARVATDILRDRLKPDGVVLSGSFFILDDPPSWRSLSRILDGTSVVIPDYCSGNPLGAGLVRTIAAALWLDGTPPRAARLGGELPLSFTLESFFDHHAPQPDTILTAAPATGDGAAAILLGREG